MFRSSMIAPNVGTGDGDGAGMDGAEGVGVADLGGGVGCGAEANTGAGLLDDRGIEAGVGIAKHFEEQWPSER